MYAVQDCSKAFVEDFFFSSEHVTIRKKASEKGNSYYMRMIQDFWHVRYLDFVLIILWRFYEDTSP